MGARAGARVHARPLKFFEGRADLLITYAKAAFWENKRYPDAYFPPEFSALYDFFLELVPGYEIVGPKRLRPIAVREMQEWAELSGGRRLSKDAVLILRRLDTEYRSAVMNRKPEDFKSVEATDVEGVKAIFRGLGARTPDERARRRNRQNDRD